MDISEQIATLSKTAVFSVTICVTDPAESINAGLRCSQHNPSDKSVFDLNIACRSHLSARCTDIQLLSHGVAVGASPRIANDAAIRRKIVHHATAGSSTQPLVELAARNNSKLSQQGSEKSGYNRTFWTPAQTYPQQAASQALK
jgi:hypothetical protein